METENSSVLQAILPYLRILKVYDAKTYQCSGVALFRKICVLITIFITWIVVVLFILLAAWGAYDRGAFISLYSIAVQSTATQVVSSHVSCMIYRSQMTKTIEYLQEAVTPRKLIEITQFYSNWNLYHLIVTRELCGLHSSWNQACLHNSFNVSHCSLYHFIELLNSCKYSIVVCLFWISGTASMDRTIRIPHKRWKCLHRLLFRFAYSISCFCNTPDNSHYGFVILPWHLPVYKCHGRWFKRSNGGNRKNATPSASLLHGGVIEIDERNPFSWSNNQVRMRNVIDVETEDPWVNIILFCV